MGARVRVIVVNFDGGDTTLRCLEALRLQTYPRSLTEIVVVDNGSIDGLAWKIPVRFPDVKLLPLLTNEGFARGNNIAMADLSAIDIIALVNNDTVADARWLEELVSALGSDATLGAACSKMVFNKRVVALEIDSGVVPLTISEIYLNEQPISERIVFDERFRSPESRDQTQTTGHQLLGKGSLWYDIATRANDLPVEVRVSLVADLECTVRVRTTSHSFDQRLPAGLSSFSVRIDSLADVINNAGGGVFPGLHGGDIGFKEVDFGQFEAPREVFSFCGGAVALRADTLREVGLFDPSYFLYYEDMDLSWRMRYAGWKIQYVPTSVVRHEHAFSSGEWSPFFRFWVDRNRRLTLVKNAPLAVAIKAITGATVWAIRDSFVPVFRSLIRFRRPNLGACRYRMKQYGSFLKALPAAVRARRHQLRNSKLKPDFVYTWISTRQEVGDHGTTGN